jgi:hypothetical protein
MKTFMSRKNPVSFFHEDMKLDAYAYPGRTRANRQPPRR